MSRPKGPRVFRPEVDMAGPANLVIRLPAAARDRLCNAALSQGLTPSEFLAKLIGRWYVEAGLSPPPED